MVEMVGVCVVAVAALGVLYLVLRALVEGLEGFRTWVCAEGWPWVQANWSVSEKTGVDVVESDCDSVMEEAQRVPLLGGAEVE